ncbi:WD40-repeat-containing domain protein [Mycena belliarum]|uniref:WD40-repeat-containing domain protein n=1 Tax=Mycena belliarum TaxID=1033014 RepID=A0AAD6UEE5_9AGAR|nr:WD40-repeat-containing domain protein [Mycena belliae]
MASSSHPAVFTTQTPYPLPPQMFMIPTTWSRYQLSQLVNKALSLAKPVPFDFLLRGDILKSSLADWCTQNAVGEEETLEIEYIESVLPPQKMSNHPHDDWVSSVSCQFEQRFLTASYDGQMRAFDYSQNQTWSSSLHGAAITSFCVVPSSSSDFHLIATASHDLTAQLSQVSLESAHKTKPLVSFHLHTAPLSGVTSNSAGSQILTASWDALIGLWDTLVPEVDEVPEPPAGDRRKRRKVEGLKPKRKAPLIVLKSHTARVSGALFNDDKTAYSCGFDSTVRSWDLEHGVCTNTITSSEKPFLSLSLAPSSAPSTLLASSTDRTVSQYDFREPYALSSLTLTHPATPSCVVRSPTHSHQILSGAYDGVARIWDLRSVKGATPVASFKAWEGDKKVLGVDWGVRGIVGVAGEGGLGVWKVGESSSPV